MILLIAGASHTGKTLLAQKILEKHKIPYLSLDHLKMGLIRSGRINLTPEDDDKLTAELWPIACEIIKTAIENHQNLTLEGIYIPFDWKKDFSSVYLKEIRYCCLIMTSHYIKAHFTDIQKYANVIETRLDDSGCTMESVLEDNENNLKLCQQYGCHYSLIDDQYTVDITI